MLLLVYTLLRCIRLSHLLYYTAICLLSISCTPRFRARNNIYGLSNILYFSLKANISMPSSTTTTTSQMDIPSSIYPYSLNTYHLSNSTLSENMLSNMLIQDLMATSYHKLYSSKTSHILQYIKLLVLISYGYQH